MLAANIARGSTNELLQVPLSSVEISSFTKLVRSMFENVKIVHTRMTCMCRALVDCNTTICTEDHQTQILAFASTKGENFLER
jgi:hypothetical protein